MGTPAEQKKASASGSDDCLSLSKVLADEYEALREWRVSGDGSEDDRW
jgi:hypothetical protein